MLYFAIVQKVSQSKIHFHLEVSHDNLFFLSINEMHFVQSIH